MPGADPERRGDEPFDLVVEELEACPRFIARVFRDVTTGESPPWLKARLVGAGMRPISNVVDITNYVMLALGSPLHAYDADTLAGGRIVVRRARTGEEIVTLDGTRRPLDPADLVIADAERAIGLAGVMGGENTEVSQKTTSVVLETANFEPLTVLRSGERHHLRSEAQTRWEKGVDPEAAGHAARYASQLLVELAGARWTGETEVRGDSPAPPRIAYRPAYAGEATGLAIGEDEQRDRLARLGFEVGADWTVTSPSWRARDVRRDVDVVEEVARFRLEDVPATLPKRQAMFGRLTHTQRLRRQVEDALAGAGLHEAYTYSLQPDDPDPNAIELPVPLSSQQRLLRTTLSVGLLGAARHNVDMGNGDVALFEVAHVYLPPGPVPQERLRLAGIVQGDFFRAKGMVEAVFATLHVEPTFVAADLRADFVVGAAVQSGWVATYGPLDLDGEWSAFELDLEELFELVPERLLYRDVISFPPLRQDLAFVVDAAVPAGELIAAAHDAAGPELRETRFLSDYRGDQIPTGKKSVAFSVAFQSSERTLSDDDAARLRGAIVAALAGRFGAELRA
jgi:phenylalanyl-tRNA synthetase beta chain